jgi:hypothetical protein
MRNRTSAGLATLAILAAAMGQAWGVVAYDQNVTSAVIFGTDNGNGGFTRDRANGVEIGLRGKLRFDSNNDPQNIFNSDGAGNYTFNAGTPNLLLPHPGWADAVTPVWNFDWSVNVNYDDSVPGRTIDDLTYLMEVDTDPSPGTIFWAADPITTPASPNFYEHSFGNNGTAQSAGVEATSNATYVTNMSTYNLVQNSVNYRFLSIPGFNPNATGTYTIRLSAISGSTTLAQSSINIQVVPEASAFMFAGLALSTSGLLTARHCRRSRKAKAAV